MPVTRDVAKDAAETAIIDRYNTFLGPIANQVVGYIAGTILGRGCPLRDRRCARHRRDAGR